ncbi:aminotransferase class V-fold PLP-dependent enzyme [Flammeovirgaceae bacterium SG7u.111]|nr:aminotransferase class V-fold PLP-dependent enzyme [Flammeovirgaceae bacterium SG7u.132]WPO34642.1 aminotransferase class V-fold PLP-dependent enzyme [Flammeovirgaceae bacterium SG7u.111]
MLEQYFEKFREQVIGNRQKFDTPYGEQTIVYADWTASGRLYEPIEKVLLKEIAPFVGNTHTETSVTGSIMTKAYHEALYIIKKHVNASKEDIIISSNSGMTGVVNKLQRILGMKVHEKHYKYFTLPEDDRPVVFLTHMEHHSNQTTWLETIADVVVVPADENGLFSLYLFDETVKKYSDRKLKITSVTACSNVTGIKTPFHQIAEIIHNYGGYCFVDFACSAPYVEIDMHPENLAQSLDAVFFSPHKFLGGPGSTGVLVFNRKLYSNKVPDNPGGGTVDWTNPWGGHKYVDDIEAKEDGGTPAFLQTIRAALSIRLKEEMGVEKMLEREEEILDIIWPELTKAPKLHILAKHVRQRLGIISFYLEEMHYNLAVRILNDRFGIQVRGGCSCAGTYGHFLLNVDPNRSKNITDKISCGDLSEKPGWVRMSIHPVMSDEEAKYIAKSISELAENQAEWAKDYEYNPLTNEYAHKNKVEVEDQMVDQWFGKKSVVQM